MAQLLLTTVETIIVADLGSVTFTHPTVDYILYDTDSYENPFTFEDLRDSGDLQSALDGGLIIVKDDTGAIVTNIRESLYQIQAELMNFNLDASGAVRVSNKSVLGSYVQDKDDLPDFLHRISDGTATQTYLEGVVTLETTGTEYAIAQSYKRHLYLAGFSQAIEITFNNFGNETNVTKRVGYFSSVNSAPYNSALDGFFLESDGTNEKLVIYKLGSLIASINRADWDDPLDGTGASGVNINFNNFTIAEFEFLYLGGSGLQLNFNVGGKLYPAHLYANSSTNSTTFIGSPVQPVRWELRSNGSDGQLGQICAGVSSGGSLQIVGYPRSASTAQGTFINANSSGVQYLISAIRLNNDNGVGFDITGSTLSLTNDPYTVRLVLNPSIAGSPTYNALGNSNFDFAVGDTSGSSTTIVTGGTALSTSYVSDRQRSGDLEANSLFQPGLDLNGNYDVVALTVEPHTTNLDVMGAINFKTL